MRITNQKNDKLMKRFLLLVMMCIPVYLLGNTGDRKISLDGWWNFKIDPYSEGIAGNWHTLVNAQGWDDMPVPGNWELRNEYAHYVGKGWYKRTFETPQNIEDKDVLLSFEAVNVNYSVWLNGKLLGDVIGGYFPQQFPISGLLKKNGENLLAVCVDNNFRSGAYWSWGGIRRPVNLIVCEKNRIERIKILAEPDLKTGKAVVNVTPCLQIDGQPYSIAYFIEKDGKVILRKEQSATEPHISMQLASNKVKLWHFDRPELYTMRVQLKNGDKVIHEMSERFGIRKVSWDNKNFYLNGEPVRLLGLNWVADDRLTGNTLPVEVYKSHIDDMRKMGVTMSRLSHVPLPKEVLDYLDEVGILVIDEIPLWGYAIYAHPNHPVSNSWLKQMVENHYNHPCIVGWSVGNEIGSQLENPDCTPYVKAAVEYVKTMDDSRVVLDVSMTANSNAKNDPSQYSDIYALNTYSWGKYAANAKKVVKNYGERPLFMSEFGCHLIGEDLEVSFEKERKALNDMRGIDFLFGASLWTYNDYRSTHRSPSSTWDNPVSENRAWGIVDAYGRHKKAYWEARKEYAPLKDMKVSQDGMKFVVELQPRTRLDLPAYRLSGYQLSLQAYNKEDVKLGNHTIQLKDICPGDNPVIQRMKLSEISKADHYKLVLSNGNGIELMDTIWYSNKPDVPIIDEYRSAKKMMRIYFKPVYGAKAYWAECKDITTGKVIVSDTVTCSSIIEWGNIQHGKSYQVSLYAMNENGCVKSQAMNCIGNGVFILPPEVKSVRGLTDSRSIGVGYSSEMSEYLYEVEYATDSSMKKDVKRVFTHLKGACFIPKLDKGTYYVRIRSYHQYQQSSEWSPIYQVKL